MIIVATGVVRCSRRCVLLWSVPFDGPVSPTTVATNGDSTQGDDQRVHRPSSHITDESMVPCCIRCFLRMRRGWGCHGRDGRASRQAAGAISRTAQRRPALRHQRSGRRRRSPGRYRTHNSSDALLSLQCNAQCSTCLSPSRPAPSPFDSLATRPVALRSPSAPSPPAVTTTAVRVCDRSTGASHSHSSSAVTAMAAKPQIIRLLTLGDSGAGS